MCRLVIEGANFHDIPGFYTEINRVFMADESWQLGPSLDAFNDLLHGGFGAMRGGGPVTLIWRDFDKSRADLGLAATRDYLTAKIARPDLFNAARFQADLDALNAGTGQSYFQILLEIIAGHPRITLRPA